MAIKIGPIRFNLKDRGYKSFGNDRNFNVPLLVASINSEATQERVKGRNMFGFYGHWPRIKFGHLTSVEGGVIDGKPAIVEPALVTTKLTAFPDGTIEHEAEFLDTEAGRTAARLHQSRAGGFSSVIDNIKSLFLGLDYVLEPNFRANRGYTMDSAYALTFDSACSLDMADIDACIRDEQLHAMHIVLDSAENRDRQASELITKLENEVEELLSMLAAKDPQKAATYDSAGTFSGRSFASFDPQSALKLINGAAAFDNAALEPLQDNLLPQDDLPTMPRGLQNLSQLDRVRDGLLPNSGAGVNYG